MASDREPAKKLRVKAPENPEWTDVQQGTLQIRSGLHGQQFSACLACCRQQTVKNNLEQFLETGLAAMAF